MHNCKIGKPASNANAATIGTKIVTKAKLDIISVAKIAITTTIIKITVIDTF